MEAVFRGAMDRRKPASVRYRTLLMILLSALVVLTSHGVSAQDGGNETAVEDDGNAKVVEGGALKFEHLYPLFLMLILAFLVWRYMVPSALSSLQVAFEIDDGLMEVHRLTKNRVDARDLLRLPKVGLGILAYMMAISGVLLLIAELIFNPSTYLEMNVLVMAGLILIPVIFSPLVTLNAQLEQLRGNSTKKKSPLFWWPLT